MLNRSEVGKELYGEMYRLTHPRCSIHIRLQVLSEVMGVGLQGTTTLILKYLWNLVLVSEVTVDYYGLTNERFRNLSLDKKILCLQLVTNKSEFEVKVNIIAELEKVLVERGVLNGNTF